MCKFNPKNEGRRMDKCMVNLIETLNNLGIKTVACCCGHGKYNMSILVKTKSGEVYDLISNKLLFRQKRFYLRDRQGYYYIPEALERKI